MKFFFALASLLFFLQPGVSLLVLDKNLRKPVHKSNYFTAIQFQQNCFPVYVSDVDSILIATDKVVKLLERKPVCYRMDTITTQHTRFLLMQDCDMTPNISITVITAIDESHTSFGFTIIKNEKSRRRAQQKLLDFATYLAQSSSVANKTRSE